MAAPLFCTPAARVTLPPPTLPHLHERAELAQVRDRGALAQWHGEGSRAVRKGVGAARKDAPAGGRGEGGAALLSPYLPPHHPRTK